MFKFLGINGTEDDLWKWFRHPQFKQLEVELKLTSEDELHAIGEKFGVIGTMSKKDSTGYREHLVDNMFRNFRGACDAQGTAIENTRENRVAMLNDALFSRWVNMQLGTFSAWREEGKGEGGSD